MEPGTGSRIESGMTTEGSGMTVAESAMTAEAFGMTVELAISR
jgi:hypothetical protein